MLKLSVLSLNFGSVGCKIFMWICVDSSAINCVNRYVPNELRGGMMSLSLAPANASVLDFSGLAVLDSCVLVFGDFLF